MTIGFYIKLYFATLAAFFLIDLIWLGLIAKNLYSKYLGYLMKPSPNWTAAILFYLLFIMGILVFAVVPGLKENSLGKSIVLGALFGLITYATYDLTNLATLKDWPITITIVDLIWGTTLSTLVTSISFLIGKWMV